MSNQINIKQQGASLPFVFDRSGQSIQGWVCTINVIQYPGDTPAISRVIPAVDNAWPGILTSAETAALDASETWRLVGVLTKAASDEEETPIIRFQITTAWVP